jgi:hypothetical protein
MRTFDPIVVPARWEPVGVRVFSRGLIPDCVVVGGRAVCGEKKLPERTAKIFSVARLGTASCPRPFEVSL